jgi:hypothetical protein
MYLIFSTLPLEMQISLVGTVVLFAWFFGGGLKGVLAVSIVGFIILNPSVVTTVIREFSAANQVYSIQQHPTIIPAPKTDSNVTKKPPIITNNTNNIVTDDNLDAVYDILMMRIPDLGTALSITGRVFSSNLLGGNIFNTIIGGKISTGEALEKYTLKTCAVDGKENLAFSRSYPTEEIPTNMCIEGCIVNFIEGKTKVKPFVNDNNEFEFVRIGMSTTNGASCSEI